MARKSKDDLFTLELGLFREEQTALTPELEARVAKLETEGFRYLDPSLVQLREYQAIATAIIEDGKNYGLIMATADGKTFVAFMVTDKALSRGQVVILAPNTALCGQHLDQARARFSGLDPETINLVTGDTPTKERTALYRKSRIVIATPQAYWNDLNRWRTTLSGVALVVFDEMHLAAERYAYIPIAQMSEEAGVQILGLTASVGGTWSKIHQVKRNLQLHHWLKIPSKLYRFPRLSEVAWVSIPPELEEIKQYLDQVLLQAYKDLAELGVKMSHFPIHSEKELEAIGKKLKGDVTRFSENGELSRVFRAISLWATYYKLRKALTYLVTESYEEFLRFSDKLAKEKTVNRAAARIWDHPNFVAAYEAVTRLVQNGVKHPKEEKLLELIRNRGEDERGIIFSRFIATNRRLTELLKAHGFTAVSLIGKSELPTARQREIISEFEAGVYRFMVSTSAGQMGLDIPSVDVVYKYSVPYTGADIIQWDGRSGRHKKGYVFTILMDDDLDRIMYFAALGQKRRMDEEAERDPATLQAKALSERGVKGLAHTSLFSGSPEKTKEWVKDIRPGELIHERFLVTRVAIKTQGERRWNYVSVQLRDRTGYITLFYNAPEGIAQAQEVACRIIKGKVVIVTAEAIAYRDETVLIVKPNRGFYVVECPQGDYQLKDYIIPRDDF